MREKTTKMILQQNFSCFQVRTRKKFIEKPDSFFSFLFTAVTHLQQQRTRNFFEILQQRHTSALGRTAFYGPVHVNPFGLTHVCFHYGFLWDFAGLAERVYDNYDDHKHHNSIHRYIN